MKRILKSISENSLFIWGFTLLNHLVLMVYIYYNIPIDYSSDFDQKFVLILVVLMIFSCYICNFISFRHSELKLCLIMLLFLISWQSIINQGVCNTLFHFLDVLHPINSFLLIYSSVSIILLGEKIGKELLKVSLGLTVVTIFSYFISYPLFIFLSLFTSFFLTLIPLLLLILYKKELKNVLRLQRRNLIVLAIVLPFSYIGLYINTIGTSFLNLIWYVEIASILAFLHLKTIFTSFQSKVYELKFSYIKAFMRLFIAVSSLLLFSFIIFRLSLSLSFLFTNILLLIFGLCTEEFIRLFKSSDMKGATDYLIVLFLKRNKMVKNLLSNEDIEQQFSEFLHNEILQNVMAIKNFNTYSANKTFGNQINLVSEELVQCIRERIDYYQPMNDADELLNTKYRSLIDRIQRRYKTERKVEVNFPVNFSLISPYDKIVYRFIEELMTNAIKYSSEGTIFLNIEVRYDCIFLTSENKFSSKESSLGYGLKNISNRLSVLGGKIDVLKEGMTFHVNIVLPIDKELCYEDFVN